MRIKIESAFVSGGVDVQNGDTIQLLDEGAWRPLPEQFRRDGREKTLVFKMKLPSGEKKDYSMNKTSQITMIREYGDDSRKWINIDLKVHSVVQNVAGKFRQVIYLTPLDWSSPTSKGADEIVKALDIKDEDIPVVD